MAMQPSALKSKIKDTIHNGLKKQFGPAAAGPAGYTGVADAQWEKMAEAISDIAMDIIEEITKNAEVQPGIPTAGGPVSQTTVGPGKIA